MKYLLFFVMMITTGNLFSNHLIELNHQSKFSKAAISDIVFARANSNTISNDGEMTNIVLHEFDCSVPVWEYDLPITSFDISEHIELVVYEFENYKGDHEVYSLFNKKDFLGIPKKFSFPGSIKVLYKGNKKCISTINQKAENALDFLSVEDQIKEVVNANPQVVEHGIYIINHHPSKSISVRYKLNGRIQSINSTNINPKEKKYIIGYVVDRPKNISILNAKFTQNN